jgi:hypothetical protein
MKNKRLIAWTVVSLWAGPILAQAAVGAGSGAGAGTGVGAAPANPTAAPTAPNGTPNGTPNGNPNAVPSQPGTIKHPRHKKTNPGTPVIKRLPAKKKPGTIMPNTVLPGEAQPQTGPAAQPTSAVQH